MQLCYRTLALNHKVHRDVENIVIQLFDPSCAAKTPPPVISRRFDVSGWNRGCTDTDQVKV
jgi:hypothetical protein